MYLAISDNFAINSDDRYFIKIGGKYYEECIAACPSLSETSVCDIEEMLLYSSRKDDNEKFTKCVVCKNFEVRDNTIKVEYGEQQTTDITSKTVKNRIYGYCKRNNILNESGFPPSILIIDSISNYKYIKVGKPESKFQSLMSRCEELKQKDNWLDIVRLFPEKHEIQKSEFWDDIECLDSLAFALSMLDKKYNDPKSRQGRTDKYGKYFILVIDRVLQLDPNNTKALSNKGYYYYHRYRNEKKDFLYTSATEIYERLVTITTETFKEKYRLAQLKKLHFEANYWSTVYAGKWYQTIKGIKEAFKELVDSYAELDDIRKKRYHTYYLRSMFAYATFCIDNTLQYWDSYADNKLLGTEIKSYMLDKAKFEEILITEKYLQNICDEKHYDEKRKFDLQDHPTYLEVKYRQAQLEQCKGIVYVMLDKPREEYEKYFRKSNEIIVNLLDYAKAQREDKFLFPHYAKEPKAINHFFLGEIDQIDICCYKARSYMKYEQARIYCILDDYEKATSILREIQDNDTCYNKAQKLLNRIKNEA